MSSNSHIYKVDHVTFTRCDHWVAASTANRSCIEQNFKFSRYMRTLRTAALMIGAFSKHRNAHRRIAEQNSDLKEKSIAMDCCAKLGWQVYYNAPVGVWSAFMQVCLCCFNALCTRLQKSTKRNPQQCGRTFTGLFVWFLQLYFGDKNTLPLNSRLLITLLNFARTFRRKF